MMRTIRFLIPAALILLSAAPAFACSFRTLGIARGMAPFFSFVASPDTAPVPEWPATEGHPPETHSSFGQVVQITEVAEGDQPEVREALERSGGRAVLVPWSVSPDCRTIGWGRFSYRWITSPTRAFLSAKLRPRSAWADGVPTFDVHAAYLEPFPHKPWFRARHYREPPEDRSRILTAEEYFQMYSALPTHEEWNEAPERSERRIREWLEAHPQLAAKYPASTLLDEARDHMRMLEGQAELERLRSIPYPLAGTYRLEVEVDGEPNRVFYVRTRPGPTTAWTVRPRENQLPMSESIKERDGYSVLVTGALDMAGLPENCSSGRQMKREGYFYMLEAPDVSPDGTRRWVGKIDLDLVVRQFPADSTLSTLARLESERFSRRYRPGRRAEVPALFIVHRDGSVTVEQQVAFEGGRRLMMHGERVSPISLVCEW